MQSPVYRERSPDLWPLSAHALATLPSPTLLVWLAHVAHNIERVLAITGDRWRPHVKTVKTPEVLALVVDRGIRRFKCATVREAEMLADLLRVHAPIAGDVLVAFPHVGPNLAALAELARSAPHVRWSILSEDPEHAAQVPNVLDIFVDLNSGMNRTGAPCGDLERIHATARAAGSRCRGLHAYDGHHGDPDRERRRASVWESNDRVRSVSAALRAEGHPIEEIVTAGTPAFPAALSDPGWRGRPEVHRVSPGTVVLGDLRAIEQVPELQLLPAALVLARVISRPSATRVTVDAGSKALSADVETVGVTGGLPGLSPVRPSEEHLPLEVTEGPVPALGTPLLFIPGHVCPTVNLYDELVLVGPTGELERARVTARGH